MGVVVSLPDFGLWLILLRGRIPDFVSIVLANGFLVGGIWLGNIGILRFQGAALRFQRELILFALFMVLNIHWTYVQPDMHLRSLNHAATSALFLGICSWNLLVPKRPEMREITRISGWLYAGLALVFCLRFLILSVDPYLNPSYLNTQGWEPVFFMSFECGYVMLATSMVVMLNHRLRRDLQIQKEAELTRQQEEFAIRRNLLEEKTRALAELKILSGMLPICASCKKIRDDHGYWSQIESYIRAHSQAEFSHGLCPDCAERLYPDIFKEKRS